MDVLRTITGIDDLVVVAEETQRDLKRLVGARSAELDVWARDFAGTEYDMEVQRGDDELGSLMADFCESDPGKIGNALLADRVRYWKEDQKGVREMCEILERMRDEAMEKGIERGARETLIANIRALMQNGGFTPQNALEMLNVPEASWPQYLALL